MEFVHPELNQEVYAIGGHYMFTKEDILPNPGGDILYLIAYAATDTSCCGIGGCGYALVPGYIHSLHLRLNNDKRYISEITPIEERLYEEISKIICQKEGVSQVHFLLESGGKKVIF
jgi:hypothetical protein